MFIQSDLKNHMMLVHYSNGSKSNVIKKTWNSKKLINLVSARKIFIRWKTESERFFFTENLIRGLDDDEINFLDIVDRAKLDAEKRQQLQEDNELLEFRERVATLQEHAIDKVRV